MATTVDYQRTTVELLQRIAREEFPGLIKAAEDAGRFIPRHVERTVERFLGCGDLREGFAWLVCDDCDHHARLAGSAPVVEAAAWPPVPPSSWTG